MDKIAQYQTHRGARRFMARVQRAYPTDVFEVTQDPNVLGWAASTRGWIVVKLVDNKAMPVLEPRGPLPREKGYVVPETWSAEYTDTFCKEPNYSWSNVKYIKCPPGYRQEDIMRKAKKAVGISRMRGRTTREACMLVFRPYNSATILIVQFIPPEVHNVIASDDDASKFQLPG